ncbi:MAG: transcription elongation factor GreA [Myxococcota bacterium]|jgi:transcription elongation factor GreA
MKREPMTPEGHAHLEAYVKNLKEVERPAITIAIEEARAHGDLKENAEYHTAKDKQGMIEAHLRAAQSRLSLAQVIDPSKLDLDRVAFGATVEVMEVDTDEERTYQIVGSDEADATNGRISYDAPLARAMIGKEEGDTFNFNAPGGVRTYELLSLEYK